MDYLMFLISLSCAYISQSNAYICLAWTLQNSSFRLKCQTSNLLAKVSIIDPTDKERGYCDIPYPRSHCITREFNMNSFISQNIISNETVFEVKGNLDVIGTWQCHHGRNLEVASTKVTTFKSIDFQKASIYVRLSGSPYVKTNTPMWLRCESKVPLVTKYVNFYFNDVLMTTISKERYGCPSSFNKTVCRLDECQCWNDGKDYLIKHKGFHYGGPLSVKCTFEFESEMEMSDCKMINIIDMRGPIIIHNKPFPFLALDYVQLTCTAFINGTNFQLVWDCLDLSPQNSLKNTTVVESALSFQVFSSMNEQPCTCKAIQNDFETATTITIKVSRAPILFISKHIVCNESRGIAVSCSGGGELPVDGFLPWVHSYNDHFIRYLKGTINGNKSIIHLNCSSEEEGNYFCQAWTSEQGIRQLNNVSDKVVIQGPPKITEKYVRKAKEAYELSLSVYSVPAPIRIQWFKGRDILPNSTHYVQTLDGVFIRRRFHGTVITTEGYSVKLTIHNYSADHGKRTYSVSLKNSIGHVTANFVTGENEFIFQTGFNYQHFLIATGALILATFILALIIILVKCGKANIRRASNIEMYQIAGSHDTNLNVYDVPVPVSHYEEVTVNSDQIFGTYHQNDQNEAKKDSSKKTEDGYEIPHEYIEVT